MPSGTTFEEKAKKENNIFTTHNYTLECDKTADKYKKTAQFGWKQSQ